MQARFNWLSHKRFLLPLKMPAVAMRRNIFSGVISKLTPERKRGILFLFPSIASSSLLLLLPLYLDQGKIWRDSIFEKRERKKGLLKCSVCGMGILGVCEIPPPFLSPPPSREFPLWKGIKDALCPRVFFWVRFLRNRHIPFFPHFFCRWRVLLGQGVVRVVVVVVVASNKKEFLKISLTTLSEYLKYSPQVSEYM